MKAAQYFLGLSYAAFLIGWAMGVRVVTTPSVPPGLYRTRRARKDEITRGSFVCIRALSDHAPSLLRATVREGGLPSTWIKVVAGLPGDMVSRSRASAPLEINGAPLNDSAAVTADSQGRALLTPIYPVIVPPNHAWLSSRHPLGYDSRYFGAVDMRAISCVAEPLWVL